MTAWGDVVINEENFPDENFRNFVLSNCGQDVLTDDVIARVEWIWIHSSSIQSLKGIEYFTALTWLACDDNQLTELDVSKNTALERLDCTGNQLTSLDVSKNSALISLSCGSNQLTSLDVSKNSALISLSCGFNPLTSLDVSKNTALEELSCDQNQLTSLDVSKNMALETLVCWGNQLSSLDVSQNTALTWLSCGINQLTSLDVSKNTALTYLECSYNPLSSFDVSKNTVLESLNCLGIGLTSLDVSKHTALTYLECSGNQLTSLDVSKNTALTWLSCGSNPLTTLDVSKNTALNRLWCYNNQLTSLDVSKNTELTELACYGNQLTSLDVSQNTALTVLEFYQNQIKDAGMDALMESLPVVDMGYMYALYDRDEGNVVTNAQVEAGKAKGWTVLYLGGNGWAEYVGDDIVVAINDENFPDENFRNYLLSQEYGTDGVLTFLEISRVKGIDVDSCGIQSLKGIEYFTALYTLSCNSNQLTSLDVSKNTALLILECACNQLTSLDVSQNTVLRRLYCFDNQLTSLDVSQNTLLTLLACYQNQIKDAAMDALVESLPTVDWGFMYALYDRDEGNVMTTLQVAAAKAKGWAVLHQFQGEWVDYTGSKEDLDGIGNVSVSDNVNDVYDLSGRKINSQSAPFNVHRSMFNGLRKGIYIVDGKKVWVK